MNLFEITLIYNENLEGNTFLNEYVEYVKSYTIKEFINELRQVILITKDMYEKNLLIAQELKLEETWLQYISKNQQINTVVNAPSPLYYKGVKVLTQELVYFKELFEKLNYDHFDYNPILDKSSIPKEIEINDFRTTTKVRPIAGLVAGFFFSLVIVFFRRILKQK